MFQYIPFSHVLHRVIALQDHVAFNVAGRLMPTQGSDDIWEMVEYIAKKEADERRWTTEQSESERAFKTEVEWPTYPVYFVEADSDGLQIVKAVGVDRPRTYHPMAYSRLPFELAKVNFEDEAGALAFVHQWGLLGYDLLIDQSEQIRLGDPLEFIWWHARAIRNLMKLYDALGRNDPKRIRVALEGVTILIGADRPQRATGRHSGPARIIRGRAFEGISGGNKKLIYFDFADYQDQPDYHDDKMHAVNLITTVIQWNISGIESTLYSRAYRFDDESALDSLFMGFMFGSLIEGIWWHLARYVAGQGDIAICKGCDHYFERTDKRQQFCPPPEEHVLEAQHGIRQRAQSLCANRYRLKKHRAK
jgi:hypothetical protein